MTFQSFEFLAFVAATAVVYFALPAWRLWTLLIASVLFCATWSVLYVVWLAMLTVFVFAWAPVIAKSSSRLPVALGVVVCLSNLLFFKCVDTSLLFPLGWIIPLGISYTTFKMISYVVDVHWKKIQPETRFEALALHIFFFPQIVSGPIQRAESFLPQLNRLPAWEGERVTRGLQWMTFGFFKKMVIADHLALLVNPVFAEPSAYPATTVLLAMYGFAWQVYADFSGLTDIAKGLALLFGIDSPDNFRGPFYAPNVQEFWRRWHITLTSWVRDYLFLPLHMQLRDWGTSALVLCIAVNMMAIALWHGFTSNFVLFGLIQTVWVMISALTMTQRNRFFKRHSGWARFRPVVGMLITFHLMTASFVFFRADSTSQAMQMFEQLASGGWTLDGLHLGLAKMDMVLVAVCLVLMEMIHRVLRDPGLRERLRVRCGWLRWAGYYALVFAILGFGHASAQQFIYFKF